MCHVMTSLAGISIEDFWFARQICTKFLDNINFALTGAIKVAAQDRQGLDENRVGVALDGWFDAREIATLLVDLFYICFMSRCKPQSQVTNSLLALRSMPSFGRSVEPTTIQAESSESSA